MGEAGSGVPGPGSATVRGGRRLLALARAALVELGYAPQEAERLLAGVDPDQPVEGIVRQALGRRA